MVSQNRAVFKASLDAMRRVESMFGKEAIDQHIESLVEGLEKQLANEDAAGDARAALLFKTLTQLCSEETADSLRTRYPRFANKESASQKP